ncbi:MAG: transposase [Planctomycetes bacterium]|nr:transposase [Planctomycetota bacterium]
MRYNDPAAYLITYTCYGTWLHGDERGSVSRDLAAYGWPRLETDPKLVHHFESKLRFPPLILDDPMRSAVDAAIREVCVHREWYLGALNVRTNHVHVVANGRVGVSKILGDFKRYSTRRLRELKLVLPDRPVWTDGGSTRYLWDTDSLAHAVHYVLHRQ